MCLASEDLAGGDFLFVERPVAVERDLPLGDNGPA
jgi:hypothetical protein